MVIDNNIKIDSMAEAARKQFESTDKRLGEIADNFHSKMQGKTIGNVIGAIFVTLMWLAGFAIALFYIRPYINYTLWMVVGGAIGLFMLAMLIDEIVKFSYYKKVSGYGNHVAQLRTRISVGRNSISSNRQEYLSAREKGWNYALSIGESIPDEASSIETTMAGMASLKTGLISTIKVMLYYAVCVLVTIIGSMMLFTSVSGVITDMFDGDVSSDLLTTVCWIGLIVACIGECILARYVWSQCDCDVTNASIGIVLLGPLMFFALELLGAGIVWLVMVVIAVVIALAGLALGIFCLCASSAGG